MLRGPEEMGISGAVVSGVEFSMDAGSRISIDALAGGVGEIAATPS